MDFFKICSKSVSFSKTSVSKFSISCVVSFSDLDFNFDLVIPIMILNNGRNPIVCSKFIQTGMRFSINPN